MIRTAFINFFSNYKRLLGTILIFGIAIGIFACILFFGVMLPIKNTDGVLYSYLTDYLKEHISLQSLTDIMTVDYLRNLLNGLAAIIADIDVTLRTIIIIELLAGALLLIATPQIVTLIYKSKLRATVATKRSKKGIVVIIMRQIISLAFFALYVIIVYFWFYAVFILPLISQLINALQSLFIAWYVHYYALPKRKLINIKNLIFLTASNIILMYFCFMLVTMISLLNVVISILIALPLFTYNACVRDITAAGYFKKLFDKA